jgi:hypothetical protein
LIYATAAEVYERRRRGLATWLRLIFDLVDQQCNPRVK